MDAAIALVVVYISSVDNTVQTFSSLVRKVWTIEDEVPYYVKEGKGT